MEYDVFFILADRSFDRAFERGEKAVNESIVRGRESLSGRVVAVPRLTPAMITRR
jgi:hypothetical protein